MYRFISNYKESNKKFYKPTGPNRLVILIRDFMQRKRRSRRGKEDYWVQSQSVMLRYSDEGKTI